jgi:hypothetical protein
MDVTITIDFSVARLCIWFDFSLYGTGNHLEDLEQRLRARETGRIGG